MSLERIPLDPLICSGTRGQLAQLIGTATSDRSTLDELLRLIDDQRGWRSKGHSLFDRIREKTLQAEKTMDRRLWSQYLFEEICVKTLYNLSRPNGPFDPDSPYWIIPNALTAARHMEIDPARVLDVVAG